MYQHDSEQINVDMTRWAEAGPTNLSNNTEVTPAFYTATAGDQESPRSSLEEQGICHYQAPENIHMTGAPHNPYELQENNSLQAIIDFLSDMESFNSPDSLSVGSSREANLPQADPATWPSNSTGNETISTSSVFENVPSSLTEVPITTVIAGKEDTKMTAPWPPTAPQKSGTAKLKARTAFSERQQNILIQRFIVQLYLTPAEMRTLAEITGLTYKQVKTWFQNRRVKHRRLQKNNSLVAEHYATNKREPGHGPFFNVPQHIPSYQEEARSEFKEHCNQHQHMMGTAFQQNAPQDLAFHRAAVDSAPGSSGYPSWPSGPAPAAMTPRPEAAGWSGPTGINQYEYNPCAFNLTNIASANNIGIGTSFEVKDGSLSTTESLPSVNNWGLTCPVKVPYQPY